MLTNPITTLDKYTLRQEQDDQRDPLDALKDAETLRTFLNHLRPYLSGPSPDVALRDIMRHLVDVVSNPATSYLLLSRIREDLTAGDVDRALADAQHLVETNGRRAEAALKQAC
ncbi:hypothetical protein [Castellaniella denitrificans]|uniref:Uncharacterized protein n=1 Tax=Castellaniella denitrificans TaxID=56119 RepID=A0ABT4LZK3_9BURK|nr:hypothetical protein [Castellaniella denitrificans]MCZ4328482.1 hypothetical protein [Castellaniella denitrificans]